MYRAQKIGGLGKLSGTRELSSGKSVTSRYSATSLLALSSKEFTPRAVPGSICAESRELSEKIMPVDSKVIVLRMRS